MKEQIRKWLKILYLTYSMLFLWLYESLSKRKWFRRYRGGKWSYVYLFETDEEFWTQIEYPSWTAATLEVEQYK